MSHDDDLKRAHAAINGSDQDEADEKTNKATEVVNLVLDSGCELFHDDRDDSYASIQINGHLETHAVRSSTFRRYVTRLVYLETGSVPSKQTLEGAVGLLEAKAQFDGELLEVVVRIGELDGNTYVDIGNDSWEVIQISRIGWSVITAPPPRLRFKRPKGLLSLPRPERGGDINSLRQFVNVRSDQEWWLLIGWLVSVFRVGYPYGVLLLIGEQGSAKSTVAKMLKAITDPNIASLRRPATNESDLIIAATNSHVVAYDNLSRLTESMSDAVCVVSTGGGLGKRRLYTDSDEELLSVMRPVILTAINNIATRGDLADRGLSITLQIPEIRRRERELWQAFDKEAPYLLGALLDGAVCGLKNIETVVVDDLPRMADLAEWVTACESGLGIPAGAFVNAYRDNRNSNYQHVLESHPIGLPILQLASEQEWEGSATELLKTLASRVPEAITKSRDWPNTGQKLSNEIERIAPALRASGVRVDKERSATKRTIILGPHQGVTSVTGVIDSEQPNEPPEVSNDSDDAYDAFFTKTNESGRVAIPDVMPKS